MRSQLWSFAAFLGGQEEAAYFFVGLQKETGSSGLCSRTLWVGQGQGRGMWWGQNVSLLIGQVMLTFGWSSSS